MRQNSLLRAARTCYHSGVYHAIGAGVIIGAILLAWSAIPASAANDLRQATPDAALQPLSERGNRLFWDNFATYSNRWLEVESPKATVAYLEGMLNLRVLSPGVSIGSVPDFNLELADYSIQADVEFRGGSQDSWFGFMLRYSDDQTFYALVVTAQAEWRLLRTEETGWQELTPNSAALPGVHPGELVMRLRADVEGDLIRLFINERPVATVQTDGVLGGGGFGVMAMAGKGYIDVSFDNLEVFAPAKDDGS